MLEYRIKRDESIDRALKKVRRARYDVLDENDAHQERHLGHNRIRSRYRRNRDQQQQPDSFDKKEYRPPDKYSPGDVLRRFRREFDGIGLMMGVSDPYQIRQQIQKALEAYDSLKLEDQKSVQRQHEQLLRYKSSLDTRL